MSEEDAPLVIASEVRAPPPKKSTNHYPAVKPPRHDVEKGFVSLNNEDESVYGADVCPEGMDVELFVIQRNYRLDMGRILAEAWRIYKTNWWRLSLPFFIAIVLCILLNVFFMMSGSFLYDVYLIGMLIMVLNGVRPSNYTNEMRIRDMGYFIYIFLPVLATALFFFIAIFPALLTLVAGELCLILLSQYKGALIVGGILVLVGFVCLIYVCVNVSFAMMLMLEYHPRLSAWACIRTSWAQVRKHWWQVLSFYLVTALIAVSGFFLLGVGLFMTIPLSYVSVCVGFRDMFGMQAKRIAPTQCSADC